MSTQKAVTASIIHGSAIGSAAYVVVARDLMVVTPGNQLCTHLIIPANSVDLRTAEVETIETWARKNKLTLNRSQMKEIVLTDNGRGRQVVPPPPMADIFRYVSLKILGVSITNGLSATDFVQDCRPIMRADTIRAEGLPCSGNEQHCVAGHLQVDCRRQATVRSQCLV
jgi:hypothetical protein